MTCPRCGGARVDGACPRCALRDEEPFELLDELGRGGMGSVWRARDRRLDRVVALKFLAGARGPTFASRLEREGRILARLEHPGIVRLYGVGELEGEPYLVLELVDGRALAAVLPLPPDRVVELGLAVLDALAYAHRQGVVHLDLKPENILLDGAGRPKVADFGIARLREGPPGTWTSQGLVAGTPAFMAPEALAGAPPDPRMDLYALGAVLHQALTGTLPLGAFAPTGTAVDKVIRRAMAPVGERYPDAAAMRQDLAAVGAAVAAGDDLPPEERTLAHGLALLSTAASGFLIYAILASVSPRITAEGELTPLVAFAPRALSDGRVATEARFEAVPILLSVGGIGVAAAAWAFVYARWRAAGWLRTEPERAIRQSWWAFGAGAVAAGGAALRRQIEGLLGDSVVFAPIVGGAAEVVALGLFWAAVIEARRVGRPLTREPLVAVGLLLAFIPPTVELARALGG